MLKFAKFMATTSGRVIRVIGGSALLWWGYNMGGAAGIIIMVIGAIPFLAGSFNFCPIAPFIHVPFSGKKILALPDAE